MIGPHSLTTNTRIDPLGVDSPEFAWLIPGVASQTHLQLAVERNGGAAGEWAWESEWVESSKPFGHGYDGPPLNPRTTYSWRVRLRLEDGTETEWSAPAGFDTGMGSEAWPSKWITAQPTEQRDRRVLYFRYEWDEVPNVTRARAYVSSLGWYRLFVNGHDLTGHALVPRWTPYDDYVEYQTYDITDDIAQGRNAVGIVVADGRFRGALGMSAKGGTYGDQLAVIAFVELEHADGTISRIDSDERWTVGLGRIRTSDPKHGERADLRIDDEAWKHVGGSLPDAQPAQLLPPHPRRLISEEVERVTSIEERPGAVIRSSRGNQIIDMGQNFAGVVRILLPAGAGRRVRLFYSEVLTPDGDIDTSYLSPGHGGRERWFQRDEVTLGSEPMEYCPSFTIHGFRYVAIEGLETLEAAAVTGIVLSSDLAEISTFTASDRRLERLWHNVLWGLRSNFVDTPTDCPTRERSGWTGDIQVFGSTAAQLVDSRNFLQRYLRNVAAEQYEDGRVPPIIPTEDSEGRKRNPIRFSSTSVGWGDVTVMLPWTLYEYYGDVETLRRQYSSAKAWVDQLAKRAATKKSLRRRLVRNTGALEQFIVDSGYHWGEWLRPGEGFGEVLGNLVTHRPVVASAYFAHSTHLLARIASVLGEEADRVEYERLATNAAEAWRAAFVREGGARIGDDKQDDYVRAIAFDLLLPSQRKTAAGRLVELIEAAEYHLGTGFLSTPMLLPVLVEAGHSAVAYRVLFQDTAPSWLAQVEGGATTIWENWVGYKPDGRAKGSHNHYAFGTVARFLQEHIGGIAPLEPGYRRFLVAPAVDSGLIHASVSLETPYGRASSRWRRTDQGVELEVTVPAGTIAEVRIGTSTDELRPGTHRLTFDDEVYAARVA